MVASLEAASLVGINWGRGIILLFTSGVKMPWAALTHVCHFSYDDEGYLDLHRKGFNTGLFICYRREDEMQM